MHDVKQELLAGSVRLVQDVVCVIEIVEGLVESERIHGKRRRFFGRDHLFGDGFELRREQSEFPECTAVRAPEKGLCLLAANILMECLPPEFRMGLGVFPQDILRANHGVLQIGPSLAFKRQRIFEIEGDDDAA